MVVDDGERGGSADGDPRKRGADEVQSREEIEVGREAEMAGDGCGDETPDQIAGDIACDVGGEGAGLLFGIAIFSEVGERQREGGGHTQALRNPQQGEGRQVGRMREQGCRDRQHDKAGDDPETAIDVTAKERHPR